MQHSNSGVGVCLGRHATCHHLSFPVAMFSASVFAFIFLWVGSCILLKTHLFGDAVIIYVRAEASGALSAGQHCTHIV